MICTNVGNGFVCSFSEGVDLEFMFEGKKTYMEFHKVCGPIFYTLKPDEEYEVALENSNWAERENWIDPDDSERFKLLWKEFDKWYEMNKGTDKTRSVYD